MVNFRQHYKLPPVSQKIEYVVCIIIKRRKIKDSASIITLRAAAAAANRSSRAFSFCLRFFRRVSGTSIAYKG